MQIAGELIDLSMSMIYDNLFKICAPWICLQNLQFHKMEAIRKIRGGS